MNVKTLILGNLNKLEQKNRIKYGEQIGLYI